MTAADMASRENIVKSMKKNIGDFRKRYGKRAKEVMYATATKMAMKEACMYRKKKVMKENKNSLPAGSMAPKTPVKQQSSLEKRFGHLKPGESAPLKGNPQKVVKVVKENDDDTDRAMGFDRGFRHFKHAEIAHELRHETKKKKSAPDNSGPHAVHINGKKWKTFSSHSHAMNVGNKIASKSTKNKVSVHKEEVEQIDELSKKTLASYANRSAEDAGHEMVKSVISRSAADRRTAQKKHEKRVKGFETAVGKLAKEGVEYVELDMDNLAHSATAHMGEDDGPHTTKLSDTDTPNFTTVVDPATVVNQPNSKGNVEANMKTAQRMTGKPFKAFRKKNLSGPEDLSGAVARVAMEEVEQIDELSKKTLGSYVKKASINAAGHHGAEVDANRDSKAYGEHTPEKRNAKARQMYHGDKSAKRLKGVRTATDKLTKEEVEQISEAKRKSAKVRFSNRLKSITQRLDAAVAKNKAASDAAAEKYGANKKVSEEVEQIDELSSDKLLAYSRKSRDELSKAKSSGDVKKQEKRRKGLKNVDIAFKKKMNKHRDEAIKNRKITIHRGIRDFSRSGGTGRYTGD